MFYLFGVKNMITYAKKKIIKDNTLYQINCFVEITERYLCLTDYQISVYFHQINPPPLRYVALRNVKHNPLPFTICKF
jgi:hypothetical protein